MSSRPAAARWPAGTADPPPPGFFGLPDYDPLIMREPALCDPHVKVFNGRAYCYAGRDRSYADAAYTMPDWQVWSSDDLIHWQRESILRPEQTYIGPSHKCFATDAAERNGRYYWYFSNHNRDTGVAVADRPGGPFRDALGEPLVRSDAVPTHPYDPCVFIDDDVDQTPYLILGFRRYYIARLNDDMISLAESFRPVTIEGVEQADDKPFLFKRGDLYYLLWGGPYAIGSSPYGPFRLGKSQRFGRGHNSVFQWNRQWYQAHVEKRKGPATHFYRFTSIGYVHFQADGEPIMQSVPCGAGRHDADWPRIDAATYFAAANTRKFECQAMRFAVRCFAPKASLTFRNVFHLKGKQTVRLSFRRITGPCELMMHRTGGSDQRRVRHQLQPSETPVDVVLPFEQPREVEDVGFDFIGDAPAGQPLAELEWLAFQPGRGMLLEYPRVWDFADSAQGWHAPGGSPPDWSPRQIRGTLPAQRTLRSPLFVTTPLDDHPFIVLGIRNASSATSGRLWFTTHANHRGPGWIYANPQTFWLEAQSVPFALERDREDWQVYLLDLRATSGWSDNLRQLRIDIGGPNDTGNWSLACVQIRRTPPSAIDASAGKPMPLL